MVKCVVGGNFMKTVGIDLTFLSGTEGATGEEVFSLGILEGLYSLDKNHRIIVYATETMKRQLLNLYPKLHVLSVKKSGKYFYRRKLKKLIKNIPVDIMYYPRLHSTINTNPGCPTAVTVHGLKSEKTSMREKSKINRKLRKIDYIIAASEFVKKEILTKNKKIKSDQVTVIHNPISDIRQGIEIVLKKEFMLAVGGDEARENMVSVIKAFGKIKNEIPHDLVIIGDVDTKSRVYKLIRKVGIENRMIMTGKMGRDILFGYYRNTDLYINASRYMGFGYTPLEALACGAKVITTKTPSLDALPEIKCEGYINNPQNYTEIANKMLIAVSKPEDEEYLQKRASIVRNFFSTEKAAESYAELFDLN